MGIWSSDLLLYVVPDKTFFFSTEKVLMFFLFLHENICCGYSLEVPWRGTLIGYIATDKRS